jgi:guanylate kinase
MNKHDRDNLNFLLNASKSTLNDWYDKVGQDDIEYAFELLAQAKAELLVSEAEIFDQVEHTDDADRAILEILEKFDNK